MSTKATKVQLYDSLNNCMCREYSIFCREVTRVNALEWMTNNDGRLNNVLHYVEPQPPPSQKENI